MSISSWWESLQKREITALRDQVDRLQKRVLQLQEENRKLAESSEQLVKSSELVIENHKKIIAGLYALKQENTELRTLLEASSLRNKV